MTIASYATAAVTLVASILIILQPSPQKVSDLTDNDNVGWWESFNGWMFQSTPTPSYSKLPLFGVTPNVRIRPSHSIRGDGFHKRYRLDIELLKETGVDLDSCSVRAEWLFAKDFIIDQWLLHRSSKVEWCFGKELIDLEAPSYSAKAKAFSLKGSVPISANSTIASIEIPELAIRYQLPSSGNGNINSVQQSKNLSISLPKIFLDCSKKISPATKEPREIVARVEEGGSSKAKVLNFQVPVATPNQNINIATCSIVSFCLFYLLIQLYKA